MTTDSFSGKLDALPATLELFRGYDARPLADGIAAGSGRHALAVGSGGSAIAAEYLARCRDTLGLGPTTVQTPMQVVLEASDLSGSHVWLFSAGADNPDVVAAARAALDRKAAFVAIVTRNAAGAAAGIVSHGGGAVYTVPVADTKDGYLATHSLLASTSALLLASDLVCGDPQGVHALLDALAGRVATMRDPRSRTSVAETMSDLTPQHTVIVASDPLLRPLAILLDTSIWEASLCHVQTADFRNLAHGRHTWMHHRADDTLILALVGVDSRQIWTAIESALPERPRRLELDHGSGGRLDNALAIIDGLGLIEAIGAVVGIDPGKPGVGEFGRAVYDNRSLAQAAEAMTAGVRHKRSAVAQFDVGDDSGMPLHEIWRGRLEALSRADIGGLVFDYDGTIVTTEGRYRLPSGEIVAELERLHAAGLRIGIATGRGGSAGEDLRKVLHAGMLASIPIGYYNGGHLRYANIDIETDPPAPDPAIAETLAWLDARPNFFTKPDFKRRPVQITIDMDKLAHRYRFVHDMSECPAFAEGRVRIAASGHSYDIVPTASSKTVVVEELRRTIPLDSEILCFGDSGSRNGNDHTLLAHPFGISVGEVCGAPNGCWALLGRQSCGPDALLRILRALVTCHDGRIRLDVGSLGLDNRAQ
jgi:hydroxymethylpyrimidine pyrophosphatase-like HAD family hydrolase/fructoselysine-6-P-deglycase FrlB-like protein